MEKLSLFQLNQQIHHSQVRRRKEERYQQMVHLIQAHDRFLSKQSHAAWSSEQMQVLELLMHQARLTQHYARRKTAMMALPSQPQKAKLETALEQERQAQLLPLTDMPSLSLSEYEEVVQEFYRRAVAQFVAQKLEQMQIEFHFQTA